MPTGVLFAHTFLHRINTIVVKITPILKKFIIFISYIILTIFAKRSAKVLNMSVLQGVLNMPECA